LLIIDFPKIDPLTATGMVTKPYYLSITNNEVVQNSKSEPKKFSFLCTFKYEFRPAEPAAEMDHPTDHRPGRGHDRPVSL
jgi:hypothetical protein